MRSGRHHALSHGHGVAGLEQAGHAPPPADLPPLPDTGCDAAGDADQRAPGLSPD
jgi:hypothetical protein